MQEKQIRQRFLEIGRRIGEIRETKGFTQEKLSQLMARSLDFIQVAELKGQITLRSMFLFAEALGCKVEDLLKKPKTTRAKPGRPFRKKTRHK